jgi:hypothetical protein
VRSRSSSERNKAAPSLWKSVALPRANIAMSGCKLLTYVRICSLLLPPCACLFLSHYKKVLPFVEGSTTMYKSSDGTYKMPVGAYNAQTGEYTTRRRSMAPTPKVRASCRHGSEWREADYLRLSDVFTPSLFNSRSALQEFAVAETIFDAIDTDKSGTVELTELAAWLIGQGEKPSAVQGWFAKVQQNLPYAVHRLLNVAHTTPLSLSLSLSLSSLSLSLSLSLSACHSSTSTKMASSRVMSGRRGGPRAS